MKLTFLGAAVAVGPTRLLQVLVGSIHLNPPTGELVKGATMWQVAKQCDGRGEDDTPTAVPIPRFLAQPPAASPWHDSVHGMSSTSSTALLSSNDYKAMNGRSSRTIPPPPLHAVGGGGGAGALLSSGLDPQAVSCGGVISCLPASEWVPVNAAFQMSQHEGAGGASHTTAGIGSPGGAGGSSTPSPSIADSLLTVAESVEGSQQQQQLKQKEQNGRQYNSGAHRASVSSVNTADDWRLVLGTPWTSLSTSSGQSNNGSAPGITTTAWSVDFSSADQLQGHPQPRQDIGMPQQQQPQQQQPQQQQQQQQQQQSQLQFRRLRSQSPTTGGLLSSPAISPASFVAVNSSLPTPIQSFVSSTPFEAFASRASWLSPLTSDGIQVKTSSSHARDILNFDASAVQQQIRDVSGITSNAPISSVSIDPTGIPATTVNPILHDLSAECESPAPTSTSSVGFQNGLRMLVDAHAATTTPKATAPGGDSPGVTAARTVSPVTLSHIDGSTLAPAPVQEDHTKPAPAVAADVAAGVAGGVLSQAEVCNAGTKVEFRLSSEEDPQRPAALSVGTEGVGQREVFPREAGVKQVAMAHKEDASGEGSSEKSVSTDESVVTTSRATHSTATPSKNAASSTASRETISPEERLRKSRERNRDHSRRSRERKKAFLEGLKKQVSELGSYRMLVEEANDLISAHTNDIHAIFTFASSGFGRILGVDPKELVGKSLMDLVDPCESQDVLRGILAALRRGGIRQVQYRMTTPKGEHAASVETSFRVVSSRLVAITRVKGESPSSLAMTLSQYLPLQSPQSQHLHFQQHTPVVPGQQFQHPQPNGLQMPMAPLSLVTQTLSMQAMQPGMGSIASSLPLKTDFDSAAPTCGW